MSFGFSLGDIAIVSKFAWEIYRACKTSSKEFENICNDISNLHVILEDLIEDLNNLEEDGVKISKRRWQRISTHLNNAMAALQDFKQEMAGYESLSTNRQRMYDAVRFRSKDIDSIRLRIVGSMASLGALEGVIIRLDNKTIRRQLHKFFREVKTAKEEDPEARSIFANCKADTIRSSESWKSMKSEIIQIGIDESVLSEREDFVKKVVGDAIDEGLLDSTTAVLLAGESSAALSALATPTGAPGGMPPAGDADPVSVRLPRRDTDQTLVQQGHQRFKARTLSGDSSASLSDSATVISARRDSDQTLLEKEYKKFMARMQAAGDISPEEMENDLYSKGVRGKSKKLNEMAGSVLRRLGLVRDERLIEAADEGDLPEILRLIHSGADVRVTDKWKWTPLHMAAYGGFHEIARVLIEHGADIEARTIDGETPALLAKKDGYKSVIEVIEQEIERRESQMGAGIIVVEAKEKSI